jgi:hypothetical protein
VDSDCGPGEYCSPSAQPAPGGQGVNACYGATPYYCHTASDTCINDADCAALDAETEAGTPQSPVPAYVCAYNVQKTLWECTKAYCAVP